MSEDPDNNVGKTSLWEKILRILREIRNIVGIIFGSIYGRAGTAIGMLGVFLLGGDDWLIVLIDRLFTLGCVLESGENICIEDPTRLQNILGTISLGIGIATTLVPVRKKWLEERREQREQELQGEIARLKARLLAIAEIFDTEKILDVEYKVDERLDIQDFADKIVNDEYCSHNIKGNKFLSKLIRAGMEVTPPKEGQPFENMPYDGISCRDLRNGVATIEW